MVLVGLTLATVDTRAGRAVVAVPVVATLVLFGWLPTIIVASVLSVALIIRSKVPTISKL